MFSGLLDLIPDFCVNGTFSVIAQVNVLYRDLANLLNLKRFSFVFDVWQDFCNMIWQLIQ